MAAASLRLRSRIPLLVDPRHAVAIRRRAVGIRNPIFNRGDRTSPLDNRVIDAGSPSRPRWTHAGFGATAAEGRAGSTDTGAGTRWWLARAISSAAETQP